MAVEYNTVPEDSPLLVAEAPKKSGRVVAAVAAALISPPGMPPATHCVARPAPDARRVKPIAPLYASLPPRAFDKVVPFKPSRHHTTTEYA